MLAGCRDILGFQASTAIQAVCASSNDCLSERDLRRPDGHAHCEEEAPAMPGATSGRVTVAAVASTLCMAPEAGAPEDGGPSSRPTPRIRRSNPADVARRRCRHRDRRRRLCGRCVRRPDLRRRPHQRSLELRSVWAPVRSVERLRRQRVPTIGYAGLQAPGNRYVAVAPNTLSSVQIHIGEDSWATAIG